MFKYQGEYLIHCVPPMGSAVTSLYDSAEEAAQALYDGYRWGKEGVGALSLSFEDVYAGDKQIGVVGVYDVGK